MNETATIQIIGAPIACKDGVKDTWRQLADWVAMQLASRYGDLVQVIYYDLYDPCCPVLPEGSQLPVVMINGEVISNGGKISIPLIRMKLEEEHGSKVFID